MSTPQQPIDSPFGFSSTALDVVAGQDLSGRRAIVTGASAGLGVETARALVAAGAEVILPVRSPDKARANTGDFADKVRFADLDLGNFDSVRHFAQTIIDDGRPVDMLINNAGIMATPLRRTPQGYEGQFATNHLGHFLLSTLLLPAMRKAPAARLVSLSSVGHRISPVVFEDVHFQTRDYDKWQAYGQSKTANALFAVEFDRRESANGIRAFSVHPGGIMTDLQRDLANEEMQAMGWINESGEVRNGFKTPPQGAATAIWCATSPLLADKGGVYCEDCNIAALTTPDERGFTGVRPHAVDADAAARLWTVSLEMLGLSE